MVIGYTQTYPWGGATGFRTKIKKGIKKHTVRRGNRWKEGMTIQHAINVRTKKYKNFKNDICTGEEKIRIWFHNRELKIMIGVSELGLVDRFEFAKNDGFDNYTDFVKWFYRSTNDGADIFRGQVVHWTKKRYA